MNKPKKEEIESLLDKMKEEEQSGAVFIVEGKKDVQSLKNLGFKNIVAINQGKGLMAVVENISAKKIIILTDLDRKGGDLKSKIKQLLLGEGKIADTEYRLKLHKLTGVRFIENLYSIIQKMEEANGS